MESFPLISVWKVSANVVNIEGGSISTAGLFQWPVSTVAQLLPRQGQLHHQHQIKQNYFLVKLRGDLQRGFCLYGDLQMLLYTGNFSVHNIYSNKQTKTQFVASSWFSDFTEGSGSSAGVRESALHRSASSPHLRDSNYSLFILCVFHVSSLDSSTTERGLVGTIKVFSEDLLIRKSENNIIDSDNRRQRGRAGVDLWLLGKGGLIRTRVWGK